MKLLALDTSTQSCSVALQVGDAVTQQYQEGAREQGQLLLPMIESVLAEAGLTLKQLDALAFGRGPGSFTGMRIGAGVVQGLAFAADLPVVPISTLQTLAQGAARELDAQKVLVALDARMDEIYWGAYQCDRDGFMTVVMVEDCLCSPLELPLLPPEEVGPGGDAPEKWLGVGDAWEVYGKVLRQQVGEQLLTARAQRFPQARDILSLAIPFVSQGDTVSAEAALPVYLRDKTAWK